MIEKIVGVMMAVGAALGILTLFVTLSIVLIEEINTKCIRKFEKPNPDYVPPPSIRRPPEQRNKRKEFTEDMKNEKDNCNYSDSIIYNDNSVR